jgi:hypothetical protein
VNGSGQAFRMYMCVGLHALELFFLLYRYTTTYIREKYCHVDDIQYYPIGVANRYD